MVMGRFRDVVVDNVLKYQFFILDCIQLSAKGLIQSPGYSSNEYYGNNEDVCWAVHIPEGDVSGLIRLSSGGLKNFKN